MNDKLPGIYKLTNKINNKIYIGESLDINYRLYRHKLSVNRKGHQSRIINAIKKYGWENFGVEILHIFQDNIDKLTLLALEAAFIEFYDSTNKIIGYNITVCGNDFSGRKASEATKKKLSDSLKKFYSNKSNHPNYGKHLSESHRLNISKANKGKVTCKPVKQIDRHTNKVIKIWKSTTDAYETITGKNSKSNNISPVCLKKKSAKGNIVRTAYGYKWEYV